MAQNAQNENGARRENRQNAFAALFETNEERVDYNDLLARFDISDSEQCYNEEDYDPEELEETKERMMPAFGGDSMPEQAITVPNAAASVNSNNL